MKETIIQAIAWVSPGMLAQVWKFMESIINYVARVNDAHIEQGIMWIKLLDLHFYNAY